jgi:hypothetical protein
MLVSVAHKPAYIEVEVPPATSYDVIYYRVQNTVSIYTGDTQTLTIKVNRERSHMPSIVACCRLERDNR